MKKLRAKLKSKLRNQGSGLILVVVAVAFIGILVGSLLTAVGYAYRLKLYDYNAKDNFYYLEQAMDEVYAGVGNETLKQMQSAYADVVNQMVEYSDSSRSYVTRDSKELNAQFKKEFMRNVANAQYMKGSSKDLDLFLQSFITNSDVRLVTGNAKVVKYYMKDGKETPVGPEGTGSNTEYSTIVLKNVILQRTANYNRSSANGEFTQTISTDIVINQPDFEMNFTSLNLDYSTLYDYCMLADSGVEITQNKQELSISGNVYAAADFYNKGYNDYLNLASKTGLSTEEATKLTNLKLVKNSAFKFSETEPYEARFGSVFDSSLGSAVSSETDVSKILSSEALPSVVEDKSTKSTYYNFYNSKVSNNSASSLRNDRIYYGSGSKTVVNYDGVEESSLYSGLYIKGANVNMQSSELIVPGTIAVLDNSRLSVYGKKGNGVGEADVWADNIALAGIGNEGSAPYAMLRANLHVRDDLEMNANYSFFQLAGRYYGYGDGTKSDAREYVPTVQANALNAYYTAKDATGADKLTSRKHYNSSAIVINGEQSKLELSNVEALYVGGRSYVQLSKDTEKTDEGVKYTYNGNTDDFKTGESISIKTNQVAYVPLNITGVTTNDIKEVTKDDGSVYYNIPLPDAIQTSKPFLWVLGAGLGTNGKAMETVPCIKYNTSSGAEYYYDFETIYELFYKAKGKKDVSFPYAYKASETAAVTAKTGAFTINSAEDLAKQFIVFYNIEISNYDASSCRTSLKDIGSQFDGFKFDQGYLSIPTDNTNVYSSGAVTAKAGTEFSITGAESLQASLKGRDADSNEVAEYDKIKGASSTIQAADVSKDMEERYAYLKWTLESPITNTTDPKYRRSNAESFYVKEAYKHGEQYLTPLNRYLNFNQIFDDTDVHPALTYKGGGDTLELGSGYSVWISSDDVVVSATRDDGVVQGIVVTKGNVYFDNTVSKFEGLIIAGDKIFVDNLVGSALPTSRERENATGDRVITSISASPEVVRTILNECMMLTGDTTGKGTQAKKLLSVFKSYEKYAYATAEVKTIDVSLKTIDTIQYSDVVRYSNWMKNVIAEAKEPEPATTSP